MFEIESTLSFNADKLVPGNDYDYVTRTSLNQGILRETGFVNQENVNSAGTWSLGLLQMDFFYRRKPWYAGQFVRKITPKIKINEVAVLFFQTLLNKQKPKLLQVLVRNVDEVFRKLTVSLPIKENGDINFSFMEKFIAELEAYLKVTGLDDYNLTEEEKTAVENLSDTNFKEFNITEIFSIKNTGNILSRNIVEDSGSTPYLCASAENNAVSSYIIYDDDYLDKGNCVFIGGKTFVVTYQEKDFYSNDSHNLVLYLKNKKFENPNTLLYMVTCIIRSMGHKYSWGDSISKTKIQSDLITLPVKDGRPDYESMSLIISAVKKMVIKDVVQYSDRKINMTKEACDVV